MAREIRVGDVFDSNNGSGPLRAVVICIEADQVVLERWNRNQGKSRRVRFVLPAEYFGKQTCGWKRRDAMLARRAKRNS